MFLELLSTPARIPWIDSQSDSDVHDWLSGQSRYLYQASTRRRFTRTASEVEVPWHGAEGSMAIVVLMVCPWLRVTQDGQTPGSDNQPQASYKSPGAGSDGIGWRLVDVLVADLGFLRWPLHRLQDKTAMWFPGKPWQNMANHIVSYNDQGLFRRIGWRHTETSETPQLDHQRSILRRKPPMARWPLSRRHFVLGVSSVKHRDG